MYSHDAVLVDSDSPAEDQQDDDWSTSPLSPDPTAPNESDLMMYMAMDRQTTEDDSTLFPDEELSSSERWPSVRSLEEVEGSDMPPALPVPVLEPMPPPSCPVLYDYQRDCTEEICTRDHCSTPIENRISTMEYQMTMHRQEYQPQSRIIMFPDHIAQGVITEVSSVGSTAVASGMAGAVVGTLIMGIFPGIMAGFYAAYAHGQSGAAGDIARALGEIALITREKALLIDRKHNLMIRAKETLAEAWEHAKELDRQHSILTKVKEFSMFAWSMTVHLIRIQINGLPPAHSGQQDGIVCQQYTTITTMRQQDRIPVSNSFGQRPQEGRDCNVAYRQGGVVLVDPSVKRISARTH